MAAAWRILCRPEEPRGGVGYWVLAAPSGRAGFVELSEVWDAEQFAAVQQRHLVEQAEREERGKDENATRRWSLKVSGSQEGVCRPHLV